MSRSLRVHPNYIHEVKTAVKRNGYPRQQDLAEDLGISPATVSNYLNGKPVDILNFQEISEKLGLEYKKIADFDWISSRNEKVEAEAVISCLDEEDAFIYVERPPIEDSCYQKLLSPGGLVLIKAPNLMGKTSLIAIILNKISQQKQDYQTANFTFLYAEKKDFTDLSQFLKWFCVSVGESLELKNQLENYWDDRFLTPTVNCTQYFERYILAQANSSLVLALDDIDLVFPYKEIAAQFLMLLRAWHERAKTHPVWKKLRLVIAHATEVYVQLDIDSSPFNVGFSIELVGFNKDQIQELVKRHGVKCSESELDQLIDLVGGHPYLLAEAFSHLKSDSNSSLEKLVQNAPTGSGIYRNYLQNLWRALQQQGDLVEALKKILTAAPNPVRSEVKQARQLYRMGLVLYTQGDDVTLRCNLYKRYFGELLGVG